LWRIISQQERKAMKVNTRRLVLFSAILSVLGVGLSFSAETGFYRGKTLTVLINFAAGGPTDIEGRLVARFLGKHLPGQPLIVVQNMPGAGGVTGTNYLGEVAKPDRLTLGYFDRRSEPTRCVRAKSKELRATMRRAYQTFARREVDRLSGEVGAETRIFGSMIVAEERPILADR
jgi:hypothetical protein